MKRLSIFLFTLILSASVFGQTGRVVGISDGDTITVLTAEKEQVKIRLAGIDAPEKAQAFGNVSKKNLSNLIFGKDVTLTGKKTDRYGRLVRKVLLDGEDINLKQIESGLAWYYRKYSNELTPADRKLYDRAEQEARTSEAGLWRDRQQTPPWDFRAAKRAGTNTPTITAAGPTRPGEVLPSRQLFRGPRGGCYYISGKKKVYVEREMCER